MEYPKWKENGKIKLMIIVGTRPEIIRLAAVIKKCRKYFDTLLVHTGQNYDYNLNGVFFKDLGLSDPELYLDAVGDDLGATMGNIIDRSYKAMVELKPDAVLVSIRKSIDSNPGDFPTKVIIEEFKNKTKDITIDRSFIEDRIESSHYGSTEAYLLLSLAINLDPQQRYNVDHMYPKDMFKKTEFGQIPAIVENKELYDFYAKKENWNTVGNLQLLNDSENKSKNKTKLSVWTRGTTQYKWSDYFMPKDDQGNYIVQDDMFKVFVEKRKKLLADAIESALNI